MMYAASRTTQWAALVVVALAAGGCFKPKVQNRSFVCDATTPACPTGFTCVQGYCDDGSGGPTPGGGGNDLSLPPGTGGNGSSEDMSMPADLSSADLSMPDMSKAPPDMAKKPDMAQQCKHYPQTCVDDSECCDNTCYIDGKCLT